ncbi:zinc-alpha-2-glycoprotein-like, partial [Pseudorasbora parva]|uniref:zinc-alpha-2-glycoprotein-like n=1 Tax=Pseudorasbora parva TaxID=51549 RepID=UPI00351E07C4
MTNMFHTLSFKIILFLVWLVSPPCLPDALQERHYLYYRFTALTKEDKFPSFSAEAESDDKQIAHYSNEERAWVRENLTDWTKAPKEPPESREWFLDQLYSLAKCTTSLNCSELHVLQRIIGCELEKRPDGSVNLIVFDEFGFDGEDCMAYNPYAEQWIDKSPKAKETKEEGDLQTGRHQFLKTCRNWISTFNNTKKSKPDVSVFAMQVSDDDKNELNLTCLATGFYPRDVQVDIRLDRTKLSHQTSEIRTNEDETFQMRTSVKIDRNHKGSYDCLVNHSSLTEPVSVVWDGKCSNCYSQWTGIVKVVAAA